MPHVISLLTHIRKLVPQICQLSFQLPHHLLIFEHPVICNNLASFNVIAYFQIVTHVGTMSVLDSAHLFAELFLDPPNFLLTFNLNPAHCLFHPMLFFPYPISNLILNTVSFHFFFSSEALILRINTALHPLL